MDEAVRDALAGLPEEKGILTPEWLPESKRALANALGVYDLSDKFRSSGVIKLPSAPYKIKIITVFSICVLASFVRLGAKD